MAKNQNSVVCRARVRVALGISLIWSITLTLTQNNHSKFVVWVWVAYCIQLQPPPPSLLGAHTPAPPDHPTIPLFLSSELPQIAPEVHS